jgi:hypothetical protein
MTMSWAQISGFDVNREKGGFHLFQMETDAYKQNKQ